MGRTATIQFIQDKDNPEKEFVLTTHAPNGKAIIYRFDASNNFTLVIPRDPVYTDDFGRERPLGRDLAADYLKAYPKLLRLVSEQADTLASGMQPLPQSTAPGAPPVPFPLPDPKPSPDASTSTQGE